MIVTIVVKITKYLMPLKLTRIYRKNEQHF